MTTPTRERSSAAAASSRRALAACLALALGCVAKGAEAAPTRKLFACPGCVVVGDETAEAPRGLLVALHGDEGTPAKVLSAWQPAAAAHGVVLFAPQCPRAERCSGSWWRWQGDPAWLLARTEEVTKEYGVDPARRWVTGWSGGATYLGMFGSRWFEAFAAISLGGGGAPPGTSACFPRAGGSCAPVHYLMGDRNPLFSLAEATRSYFEGCGHAVTWDLQAGANHGGEWRAYSLGVEEILGWLLAHPAGCSEPPPPESVPSASVAPPPGPSPASPSASAPPPSGASTPVPRCGCTVSAQGAPSWLFLAIGALLLRLLRVSWSLSDRRHRPHRR
jgi:hypothetical protein